MELAWECTPNPGWCKGEIPTLPEGSSGTSPGCQNLKKHLRWSHLELWWPKAGCKRHTTHYVGWSSTLGVEGGKWGWTCWTLSQRGPPCPPLLPQHWKARGTPNTFKEQPEIFETPSLLLVILHIQSVLQRHIFLASFLDVRLPFLWIAIIKRLQNVCQMLYWFTLSAAHSSQWCSKGSGNIVPAASITHPAERLVKLRLFIYRANQ